MAAFVDISLLDVRARNLMVIMLSIHTKSHTVRVRPTLKLVERFRNGSVRELYERSIYERSFTSEPFIEKYQAKPAISNELSHIMFTCKHNRVFRRDREPSRIPEATLKRLRRKGRKLKEFVYVCIRPRNYTEFAPSSSPLPYAMFAPTLFEFDPTKSSSPQD